MSGSGRIISIHILLFLAGFLLLNAENEKRLLILHDPDYFNSQIQVLEAKLQDLSTKYNQLQTQTANEIQGLMIRINNTETQKSGIKTRSGSLTYNRKKGVFSSGIGL